MHRYRYCLVVLVLTAALALVACKPVENSHYTYVPIAANGGCTFSQEASQFYSLLANDKAQRHAALACNVALNAAALNRAQSLAINGYFAHCDLAGICANDYARAAGCKLPSDYGAGNNIESLVAGTGDAEAAYTALMASPKHRAHLLGDGDFFRAQDQIGIAFYSRAESPYTFYWVVLIGRCV